MSPNLIYLLVDGRETQDATALVYEAFFSARSCFKNVTRETHEGFFSLLHFESGLQIECLSLRCRLSAPELHKDGECRIAADNRSDHSLFEKKKKCMCA